MNIKFKCPECGGERLNCIEDGTYHSEIIRIDEEGDFDYGSIVAEGSPIHYECISCGYVLLDEDKNIIVDNIDVVEWCKKNCSQD